MRETRQPVMLAHRIQEAIRIGAWIEVECLVAAEKAGNSHRGEWEINICIYQEGKVHRAVYVTGRDLAPRVIKTTGGLMALAMELSAQAFVCPYQAGKREMWVFDTSVLPDDLSLVDTSGRIKRLPGADSP